MTTIRPLTMGRLLAVFMLAPTLWSTPAPVTAAGPPLSDADRCEHSKTRPVNGLAPLCIRTSTVGYEAGSLYYYIKNDWWLWEWYRFAPAGEFTQRYNESPGSSEGIKSAIERIKVYKVTAGIWWEGPYQPNFWDEHDVDIEIHCGPDTWPRGWHRGECGRVRSYRVPRGDRLGLDRFRMRLIGPDSAWYSLRYQCSNAGIEGIPATVREGTRGSLCSLANATNNPLHNRIKNLRAWVVEDRVDEEYLPISFGVPFDERPLVFASMQTANGMDTAKAKVANVTRKGYDVRIEEETSNDSETGHIKERVRHYAIEPGPIHDAGGSRIGEAGSVEVDQPNRDTWHTIELDHQYDTSLMVVMMMNTANGPQPAHVRLRHIEDDRFEFQIEEWAYLDDGRHTTERLSYMAVEWGTHLLPDGSTMQAQKHLFDHEWRTVEFLSRFNERPIVFSQVQTPFGQDPVLTRQKDISAEGVTIRLQEEEEREKAGPFHIREEVAVISIQ